MTACDRVPNTSDLAHGTFYSSRMMMMMMMMRRWYESTFWVPAYICVLRIQSHCGWDG